METTPNRYTLETFTRESLPDLDVAVLGALELFTTASLPMLTLGTHARPLVVGSGNAAVTGSILYEDRDAILTNESTYRHTLHRYPIVASATLISASGGKHAAGIAEHLRKRRIDVRLFTANEHAPAREFVDPDRVFVFPKNREPYTYNTSTYMGMLLAKTGEDPEALHRFLTEEVAPRIPDTLGGYDAFFFILPPRFSLIHDMLFLKFDELFGGHVRGRAFTLDQAMHGRTAVLWEKELFVSFGEENKVFGDEKQRLFIPIPEGADYAAMMAITYFLIGHIQKQHPPYFKEHIARYVTMMAEMFGQDIEVIVE
ncbi:MAG: hypothetical protein Q8P16_01905 [bacterium]|nr:hypothetical protein [bacterium]